MAGAVAHTIPIRITAARPLMRLLLANDR
jgi:hypothetical protein